MPNILAICSSVLGDNSVSTMLVDEFVGRLLTEQPKATIVRKDLGTNPVPHLTTASVGGVRANPATDAERRARILSDHLIAELRAADWVVIGVPMYNFGIPTGLRSWFDHVLRAGETFAYTEAGAQGLLDEKRVIVVTTRGGYYADDPGRALDFQEPYLRSLLSFIGLTDVTVVRVEGLGYGTEVREAAIAAGRGALALVN